MAHPKINGSLDAPSDPSAVVPVSETLESRRGNKVFAAWLILGYLLVVAFSALSHFSTAPLKAFLTGLNEARAVCRT